VAVSRQRALDRVGDGRFVFNDQDPQWSSSVRRRVPGRVPGASGAEAGSSRGQADIVAR
jgi:hypothetical protein